MTNGNTEITDKDAKKLLDQKERKVVVSEDELKDLIHDHVKDEVQKEIKYDKASLFTVFGIFASIVTFVSLEIQILKTVCDIWNVIGFSITILASLLTFILILDYIGRGWRNEFKVELKKFPWILIVFILLLFATGIFCLFRGDENFCKENVIFQRYESDFNDRQVELEKTMEGYIDNKMNDLRMDINKNTESIRSHGH